MIVRVQSFQPFADTTVEVVGLTVLIGDSNAGKSAFIRALGGALFNRPGSNFVRVGESNASVAIEGLPTAVKGTETTVVWVKGKTAHYFRVDGVLYKNVKTSAPDVLQAAGYRDVWVGDESKNRGDSIRPQVARQFDPLFLLDRPGSFLSDALTSASRLDVIQTAAGRAARDLRNARQETVKGEVDLVNHRRELAALEPAAALWADVQVLRARLELGIRLRKRLETARGLLAERLALQQVGDVPVPGLPEPPSVAVEPVARMVQTLAMAAHDWQRLSPLRLAQVEGLPAGDPVRLSQDAARCALIGNALAERGRLRRAGVVPALSAVPVFPAGLAACAKLLTTLSADLTEQAMAVAVLGRAEAAARSTTQDAEEAESAVHTALANLDVCPLCEQSLATKSQEIRKALKGEGCLGQSADDEPVFTLVARDRVAAATVRDWANRAEAMGAPAAKVALARADAEAMDAWRDANGGGKVPD